MTESLKDYEAFVPGLRELRAIEHENRQVAFLGLTTKVAGHEVVPFTPSHRLALAAVGNTFVVNGSGGMEEAYQVLWHLSEWYEHRQGPQAARAEEERIKLREAVVAANPANLVRDVRAYLASQLADRPELPGDGADESPDHSRHVHWVAVEASFWMNIHGGFTFDSYLRTPYLVLQQLRRAWRINNPSRIPMPNGHLVVDHPIFRNFSDMIAGDAHVAHRAAIAAAIRAQTVRLPS